MTQLPEQVHNEVLKYLNNGLPQQKLLKFLEEENNKVLTHDRVVSILNGKDLEIYLHMGANDSSSSEEVSDLIHLCIGNNCFTVEGAESCAKLLNVVNPSQSIITRREVKRIVGEELFSTIDDNGGFWKAIVATRKLVSEHKLSPRTTFELLRYLGNN